MKTIKRRNKRRERQRRKKRLLLTGCLGLSLVFVIVLLFIVFSVKRSASLEYGEKLSADIFKRFNFLNVTIEEDTDDLFSPGQYEIPVKMGLLKFKCNLTVSDTKAPDVTLNEISIGYGKELLANDFVKSVNEISDYTVSYVNSPDWKLIASTQKISISVKDEWDNETIKETTLIIKNYPQIVDIELGSDIESISETLRGYFGEIYDLKINEEDISKVGIFPITVSNPQNNYDIEINVIDTIAPKLETMDVIAPVGFTTEPDIFVKDLYDLSSVEISYEKEVDFNSEGTFLVSIKATDISGNETVKDANITLITDNEAPVFTYAKDFDSFVGESIIFRERVKVTDNCTQLPEIKIDAKSVNIDQVGEYIVNYTATDLAGNVSNASLKVNVREKTKEDEELAEKVKSIIARITTENMTKRQKADAIYNYVYNHITYVSRPKQDFVKAALEAINGRGGCFNYASLAMFLFDEVGIKNMFMETKVHYWNIIDIDDGHGWYHFDATPSPELPKIFLWTDAEMMDYSNRQNRTHHYDRSKYPVIP